MAMLHWKWLGRRPYDPVHRMQLQLREAILRGEAEPTLLLVEHEPVITLGRRGGDLALGADALRAQGVAVREVERGGLATYHGPGQLVGYPVLPLARFGLSVPRLVRALEAALIGYAGDRGLDAARREGLPGVWCGDRKIGAIGLHVHRGVSIHGFALNLTVDTAAYRWIVPCGIDPAEGRVSSVAELLGQADPPEIAASEVAERLVHRILQDRRRP